MAVVLRFPDRPPAVTPHGPRTEGPSATVVILPCIRREPMDMAARMSGELEQLQA
jgi:hypothetical protein